MSSGDAGGGAFAAAAATIAAAQAAAAAAAAAASAGPGAGAGVGVGAPPFEEAWLPVACGPIQGLMLLRSQRILINAGTPAAALVSPTEFERLGGKGSCKQWRSSIRVVDGAPRARAHTHAQSMISKP